MITSTPITYIVIKINLNPFLVSHIQQILAHPVQCGMEITVPLVKCNIDVEKVINPTKKLENCGVPQQVSPQQPVGGGYSMHK